ARTKALRRAAGTGAFALLFLLPMTSQSSSLRRRARAAFTLLEMLIVLALIGLLAALAVVKFGGVDENARIDMAGVFVNSSADAALLMYKQHVGRYPTTEEGLRALIQAPGNTEARWRGPYIKGK